MKLAVEIITPAFAKQALSNPVNNRRISQAKVLQYADDMKNGRWNENNGETLKFTADGKLLDGQHRLTAILHAQATLGMAVARNVPLEAFVTIDSGKTRNLSDVLGIEGHKHTVTLASAARGVYNYLTGMGNSTTPTRAALEGFIAAHPYLAEVSSLVGNKLRLLPRGPIAAILYLGTHAGQYKDEMHHFVDGLDSGAAMFKGDARLTLREWILNNRGNKKNILTQELLLFGTARAWNAYTDGRAYEKMGFARGVTFNRKFLNINGCDRTKFPEVPLLKE